MAGGEMKNLQGGGSFHIEMMFPFYKRVNIASGHLNWQFFIPDSRLWQDITF